MLVRLLVKQGAEVKIIMTPLAKEFITPLTLATLAKNPILVDFFDPENGAWNSHVSLGEWADLYLIAPATANTLAKMATGVADNLLLTTYLSARCPVFVAPAMDLDMYAHVATGRNLKTLANDGVVIVEPTSGELASGLIGKGRMAEAEDIVKSVEDFFAEKKKSPLKGKRILVTSGATLEAIDPVRYISNHSTGKMGYALAGELKSRGAEVVLISGKVSVDKPKGVENIDVTSAEDMYNACNEHFESCDGAIMCAAVADYTPSDVASTKIKKSADDMSISLKKTKDIAQSLGKKKGSRILVGFALETDNEADNAKGKLERKGFDFIVLNSLQDKGAGFGHDTNKISILDKTGSREDHPLEGKDKAASKIIDKLETFF